MPTSLDDTKYISCSPLNNRGISQISMNEYEIIRQNNARDVNQKTYLLCIISCKKNVHTKKWIKKYWLDDLINSTGNIDYLFIYGDNKGENDWEIREDELHLKCDDGYFKLNEKMTCLWNYLTKHHLKKYDFYIKSDDDNYIHNTKFHKLLLDTSHINFFGPYNNIETMGKWNGLPTGKWNGPFYSGGIYWFSKEVLDYYVSNITTTHLIQSRTEDKLFSDIIRPKFPINKYTGMISFSGWPDFKNYKELGFFDAKKDIHTYNNSTVISNLKDINTYEFFAKCYREDNN
jgi:hypothetical protein